MFPQKENATIWKQEISNEEEYKKIYDNYLHTLGNLTFTGYNSELGTRPFKQKKKIIKENSKANILNKDVLSAKKWDENSILNRATNLANILINKFAYKNEMLSKQKNNEVCFSITEYHNFTGNKPSGFDFDSEFIRVNSWADLLSKFMLLMYGLNDSLLINLANKNYTPGKAKKIYLTNDKEKLRNAKEIEKTGIFYEVNLSANNIVSFIKELIVSMKFEISDFNIYLTHIPLKLSQNNFT
ncbi:DUF1524 domain-containing protein [Seminibacterium arietis]|uniref:DUF1524 domain-containing protein n=1 Tax=Seminibacterium arietis TaxID=1173502 RepID=A0ABW3I7I6_9PAST